MNTVNRQKVMNLMGLAMRAGKLITGEELTIAEIRKIGVCGNRCK